MRARLASGMAACVAMGLLVLTGCYPIELDAHGGKVIIPRGEGFFQLDPAARKAELVYAPPAGESPVFALYAPDGKSVVAVSQIGGGMGGAQVYRHVTIADGKARKLFEGQNGAYCRVSPDGKWLSVAIMSQQAKPPMKEGMPEIHLINIADGSSRVLASNAGTRHVWLPDGSAVLAFQAMVKDEQGSYTGSLSVVPVGEGDAKPLVTLMGQDLFYDLSPDGKTILVAANAAAVGDAKLVPSEETALYEFKIDTGALRKVNNTVGFAFFSPKGEKVLVGRSSGGNGPGDNGLVLEVTDTAFKAYKPVANDAAAQAGGMGSSADIYPLWLDNDTVVYLAEKAVYGTSGKNLMLTTVKADGTGSTNLQAVIDGAAVEPAKNE